MINYRKRLMPRRSGGLRAPWTLKAKHLGCAVRHQRSKLLGHRSSETNSAPRSTHRRCMQESVQCSCQPVPPSDYVGRSCLGALGRHRSFYYRLHLPVNICPAWEHRISNSSEASTRFSPALHQEPSGKVFMGNNQQISDGML